MAQYIPATGYGRLLAHTLMTEPNVTPVHIAQAAATINTLLDVIDAQRGAPVTKVTNSVNLEPLRALRAWHQNQADILEQADQSPRVQAHHRETVRLLNQYFVDKL